MSKLKALFLVGSLKQNSEDTNTLLLSQFLAKQFSTYDTEYEIVKLADRNIKPGTCTNIDSDDWPAILEKILNSDSHFCNPNMVGNSIFTYSESNRKIR